MKKDRMVQQVGCAMANAFFSRAAEIGVNDMEHYSCASQGCLQRPVVRVDRISRRRVYERLLYCDEHVNLFLQGYYGGQHIGRGVRDSCLDGFVFDIEILLYDDRPDSFCQFCLREAGGSKHLDCRISMFDAAALWWQVESFQHPRPLTHNAMASVIAALGGRLTRVVIDEFFPAQEVAYKAKLHIQQMNNTNIVDVRPSDAVVLAVVCDAPIVVSNDVITRLEKWRQEERDSWDMNRY
jgi:uncharacterized protein